MGSPDTGAREPQRLASLIAELRAVAEGEPTTMNQYEAADWLRTIEELAALAAGVGVPPDALTEALERIVAVTGTSTEANLIARNALAAVPPYTGLAEFLRPRTAWVNKHTGDETIITSFASRIERVPDAAGGFKDDPQLVVHHTVNVPPGFTEGYGDDLRSFLAHWRPAGVGEARPAEPPQTKTVEMPIAMRGPAVYWRTKDSVGAPAEEQPDAREALSVFVETCRDLGRGALRTALETSDTPADDALDVFDRTLDHIAGYASGASAPLAALTKERDGLREQLDAGERDNTRLLNECVEAEDRVSVLTGALEEALSYRRTGRMPHDVLERLRAALGDVAAGESLEANSAKNAEVRATADKEA